eukprot:CAMPEP_0117524746 /NCGR_PEP_ID=MMETSP0784-20121206/35409_1 /TAXON_ID=39447 /ORGANISM="" /LENGTH=518 /DNA_ID=CAMNT_0005320913 /DNA_START=44 /DNA_END=1600 /DNA_ORIENTATION=+
MAAVENAPDGSAPVEAEAEIPVEERVTTAENAKAVGNDLLKKGDLAEAVLKYSEGIKLMEPLLDKDPAEAGGAEMQQRAKVVYVALRLNSAQARLKQGDLMGVVEQADKVLLIEKDNAKALYRRAMASIQFDTEGRLEQARVDFARVAQLEPANRDAREQLAKAKERLKAARQLEKERYASALKGGGLYQEQHAKLAREQLRYEGEVARRKEAGEDDLSFEDWKKKEKEKEDDQKKKEKEAKEKAQADQARNLEQKQFEEDNERRKADGLEELSLEAWREEKTMATRKDEVVTTDELDLDDEEKKLLSETKKKGYYHGRLGTVLSSAAPKPQQVDGEVQIAPGGGAAKAGHSEWNQAGTWEEKDTTTWAKAEMTKWLKNANVTSQCVQLATGQSVTMSAKISQVKSLNGDAQIVVVRKQPRYGFTFDAELSFHLTVRPSEVENAEGAATSPGTETYKGKFSLPELADFVELKDLRIDVSWKGERPPARVQPMADEWVEKLRDNVREQVASFTKEYREL